MRGKRRKDIELYVDRVFPMLSKKNIYMMRPNGQIVLAPTCRRSLVQRIKHNYVKAVRAGRKVQ